MTASFASIHAGVERLARRFARERADRQLRRELDPADFDALRQAGFLLTAVPPEYGGAWLGRAVSTRPVCEILRTLSRAESSVALVAAMHPVVLQMVAGSDAEPPPEWRVAWRVQRQWAFGTAAAGDWWGTISSEPGSGGDLQRTKTIARLDPAVSPGGYRLTGHKHFASGAGISSFMVTTAVPAGESQPDFFIVDMRGRPWDGSAGLRLTAAWDGHGMTATQSHAFAFDHLPAVRLARTIEGGGIGPADLAFLECCCSAVIAGIVEVAVKTARRQLVARGDRLGAYERVEWARAEIEAWLVEAAFRAMLQSVEAGSEVFQPVLMGKTAIADLAESALGRICRAIGGGSYNRGSPFGHWFEDVRALGFLRPPWGAGYAALIDKLFVADGDSG